MSQFVLVILFLTGLVLQVSYEYHTVNVVCRGGGVQQAVFFFSCVFVVSSAAQDLSISQQYIWGMEG